MNNTAQLIPNANVYTVDPAHPQAETVVRNGHRRGALRGFAAARKRESWDDDHPTLRLRLEQHIAGYTHGVASDAQFVGRAA